MELRQMLKVLLRWWWLAVIPVVVVTGYVGLTFQTPPTAYQVVVRFTAGGKPADTLSADYDRYHAWLSSEYVARALANVAQTGTFAQAVSERLADVGLRIETRAIRGAIITEHAESILVVYCTWGDAAQIVTLTEAISAEIVENGVAYFPQMQGIGTVARQVDAPVPIALPPSLKAQLLGPGLRLMLAAMVGLGLVFLVHYLDPMAREYTDVERLGISVLVSIPKNVKRNDFRYKTSRFTFHRTL